MQPQSMARTPQHSNFVSVLKHGRLYYPANQRYGANMQVLCDRCNLSNLKICVGYQQTDLCLTCANIVAESASSSAPFTPLPPPAPMHHDNPFPLPSSRRPPWDSIRVGRPTGVQRHTPRQPHFPSTSTKSMHGATSSINDASARNVSTAAPMIGDTIHRQCDDNNLDITNAQFSIPIVNDSECF